MGSFQVVEKWRLEFTTGFWIQVDSTATGTSGRLVFVDEKVGTLGARIRKGVGPLDSCVWCWAHHGPTWTYACGLIELTYSIYHLPISYWPYLPMAYSTKFPWLQAWSNNRVRSVFKTERFKWFFEHVLSRMYGCHSPRSSVSRNMCWLILYTLVYAYNMHAFKNVQLQSLFNAL